MSPSGANASTGIGASASSGATGQVQPTSGAVKVDVKVAPTLANTVKISADSAFALAKASPDAGEISSAELEMKDKALVYNIKMVKGAGASVVHVDAMTGEVVKDKKYGGLKASAENDKGLKKLEDAKEDSTKAAKP
jgi:homoaconitase/3-isopropylmalate dehydratase large subunit